MIKINSRSRFKILDSSKIEQLTEDNILLLGKYPCFFNHAIGGAWCHNKDFGYVYDSCLTELEPEEEDGTTLTGIWFAPLDDNITKRISKRYQLYK